MKVYEVFLWRTRPTAIVTNLFILLLIFHPLLRYHDLAMYRLFLVEVFQNQVVVALDAYGLGDGSVTVERSGQQMLL